MPSNFDTHFTSIRKLFSDHGIKKVTMDDIAHYLHISKKTIYKQYSNKRELVCDVYRDDYSRFKTVLQSLEQKDIDVISRTIQLCSIVIGKASRMKNNVLPDLQKYYIDFHSEIIDLYREPIQKTFSGILRDGKTQQIFRDEINPHSVAQIFIYFFKSYVSDQISHPKGVYTLSWVDVFDYHFRSICTPAGLGKWNGFKKHVSIDKLIPMINN